MPTDDAVRMLRLLMPFFDEVMRAIISPSTTTADAIKIVSSAIPIRRRWETWLAEYLQALKRNPCRSA